MLPVWCVTNSMAPRKWLSVFTVFLALAASGGLAAQVVSFTAQPQVSTGSKPDSLAVADVTGDGIPDVIVADGGTSTINVLRGLGNGFFQAFTTITTGQSPRAIAVGDFNRDGKLDLAVANFGSDTVSVLLGNGNGTFRQFATLEATGPSAIVVADFNGDGKLDLAVAATNSNQVAIFTGTGDGNFVPFSSAAVGGRAVSIVVADFNADGKLDLAVADSSSNAVAILLGNGNGTFQSARSFAAGALPAYLVAADFNGDGRMDLAVANANGFSDGTVTILQGLGNGSFQVLQTLGTGSNPSFLVAADFNLDGKLDLMVANTGSNSISLLLGIGNGNFQPQLDFAAGSAPSWMAVADLNGDGRADLMVADSDSNSLSVLINRTAAAVQPSIRSTVNAGSMQGGPVAPGELVAVFGTNIGPSTPASLQLDTSGQVATTLSQTQVFFDNVAAPLVFVSSGQVTAAVPFGVAGRASTQMTVINAGATSASATLSVSQSAPSVFTADASGSGAGAILNQDGTLNNSANPASVGSVVALFVTGAGATNPPSADGLLATGLATIANAVSVTIGGQAARVFYAGSAPGLIAGVEQINVQVPEGIGSGAAAIQVQIGAAVSQAGVTVSIE